MSNNCQLNLTLNLTLREIAKFCKGQGHLGWLTFERKINHFRFEYIAFFFLVLKLENEENKFPLR